MLLSYFPSVDPGELHGLILIPLSFTHTIRGARVDSSLCQLHFCLVNAQLDCFQGSGSISKAPVAFLVSAMHTEVYFGGYTGVELMDHRVCEYSIL